MNEFMSVYIKGLTSQECSDKETKKPNFGKLSHFIDPTRPIRSNIHVSIYPDKIVGTYEHRLPAHTDHTFIKPFPMGSPNDETQRLVNDAKATARNYDGSVNGYNISASTLSSSLVSNGSDFKSPPPPKLSVSAKANGSALHGEVQLYSAVCTCSPVFWGVLVCSTSCISLCSCPLPLTQMQHHVDSPFSHRHWR